MSNYAIKRIFGEQAFEVSGPEKEWVETQAEALAAQFTTENSGSVKKQKPTKRRPSSISKATGTNPKTASTEESLVVQKLDNSAIDLLVNYVAERQTAFDKLVPNQAAIIAKFLKDKLAINHISKEDLAHIYARVGTWKTVNHQNQMDNAADRNKYFIRKDGKFELTYAGEKFAQDTARNAEKA